MLPSKGNRDLAISNLLDCQRAHTNSWTREIKTQALRVEDDLAVRRSIRSLGYDKSQHLKSEKS